ncbi:YcxB family protein [Mucilaginibacter xinganensis]|nr:YcxB family protein [Mucilaginibacter xinganensis]
MNTPDYTRVMFIGLYKKPVFILFSIFGLYLLTTVALDYFGVINYYATQPLLELISGVFLVFAPTLIVIMAVSQFKSNPNFQNDIAYSFSDDGIVIQGTTFKSEISWAHIIKQKEISGFLILYHTKKFGNFIDKSKLSNDQLLFIKTKIIKK